MTTPAPASPVQIFRHEDYDGIYPVDAIRNDDAGYYVQFDAYAKVEAERDRLRAALILAHEQFQYMVHIMNERGAPFYIGADSECQSRIEALAAALKETP